MVITIQSDEEWLEFADRTGHPEWKNDSKYATRQLRMKNQDLLDKMIESWTITKDKLDAMEILQSAGIAAGAVFNEKEIIENEHLHSRNWFQAIERDVIGTKRHPKPAMHLSKAEINYDRPAPTLGQHNELVLSTFLGISDSEIRNMQERNIIGTEPLN
jgi:crotonobetainyl-CoA:carnitine CoA-transferase CaiB-like acyl-CoA transferase